MRISNDKGEASLDNANAADQKVGKSTGRKLAEYAMLPERIQTYQKIRMQVLKFTGGGFGTLAGVVLASPLLAESEDTNSPLSVFAAFAP